VGVSGELAAPAGAGAVVQCRRRRVRKRIRPPRGLRLLRSLCVYLALGVYLALSLIKKRSHVSFTRLREYRCGCQKCGVNPADEIAPPIRREVKHPRSLAPTPDSSSHPRARSHAPQAQPWRRPYARSRSSSSSSRRVALCALGHSPAHQRNCAAAPCATQEDDGEIAIPYVQLEELLKHGIAAGTPSSAIASSCAPTRMMSSSVPPHHPYRPQATSGS